MPSPSLRPRDERLVIGITGHIGVGKTSAGKYLSSMYGFQYLRYSQVLLEWKGPERKAHLQEIGWEIMAGGGQSELNRRLIAQIMPNSDVAVDGLRHPLDYESLKHSFASAFHLLYIDSPLKTRWDRLKDQDRYASIGAFEAADSHPVEQQIESLRANAALVLHNESTLQDLYVALDQAIRGFGRGGHS